MKRRYMTLAIVLAGAGVALCIGAVATQRLGDDEVTVSIDQVPAPVKTALLAQGGTINEIEMETENGQTVYEAEVVVNGKVVDVAVSPDGTVLGAESDDEDEANDADDEEDQDDEVQVSLAEVPEAVKATILNEAAGAEIKEIEKETENGQVLYSAELVGDGQEVGIEVAPDGKLLGKEVEDEDDDK